MTQVIGSEAILCGQALGNAQAPCLLHGKVTGASLEITVRAPSAAYAEAVLRHASTLFK